MHHRGPQAPTGHHWADPSGPSAPRRPDCGHRTTHTCPDCGKCTWCTPEHLHDAPTACTCDYYDD